MIGARLQGGVPTQAGSAGVVCLPARLTLMLRQGVDWLESRLRPRLPTPVFNVARHIAFCLVRPGRIFRSLGLLGGFRFAIVPSWSELRSWVARAAPKCFFLKVRGLDFPVRCRVSTSDLEVFRQVFVNLDYQPVGGLERPRLMIDCGANVGLTSVWFLSRYPELEVVAIEPDPGNAAIARKNLEPFGSRAMLVERAVWSHATPLAIVRGAFGDGREWSLQTIAPTSEGSQDVVAIDLQSLVDELGIRSIDLLKMDIEGAEGAVFEDGTPGWLGLVENLVIEIHGAGNEAIVHAAIPECEFTRRGAGELAWFIRKTRAGELSRAADWPQSPSAVISSVQE